MNLQTYRENGRYLIDIVHFIMYLSLNKLAKHVTSKKLHCVDFSIEKPFHFTEVFLTSQRKKSNGFTVWEIKKNTPTE